MKMVSDKGWREAKRSMILGLLYFLNWCCFALAVFIHFRNGF